MALTPTQYKAFTFIRGFIADNGYPPTFQQIANYMGTTRGAVTFVMQRLEKRGYISRTPHTANTIRVLKAPEAA